jgi:hypothetical protein
MVQSAMCRWIQQDWPKPYSCRRAFIGSTRLARRAGTKLAIPGKLVWGAVAAPFCIISDLIHEDPGTQEIEVP